MENNVETLETNFPIYFTKSILSGNQSLIFRIIKYFNDTNSYPVKKLDLKIKIILSYFKKIFKFY